MHLNLLSQLDRNEFRYLEITLCFYIWLYETFVPSKPQQSPSLAQVKIEEAKRELVSILIVHSMVDEMWFLTFYVKAILFLQFQAAIDTQFEMNVDFK